MLTLVWFQVSLIAYFKVYVVDSLSKEIIISIAQQSGFENKILHLHVIYTLSCMPI